METKFTPGPWWACTDPTDQPVPYYRGLVASISLSPAISVCTGDSGDKSGRVCHAAEWEPNANLIAAAPDLYAALEAMVTSGPDLNDDGSDVFEVARAALAKARGEA